MNDIQAVDKKLKEAFDLVADSLVTAGCSERLKSSYDLVDANESAIALEIMCSNLYEFECRIPEKAYDLFAEVGVNLKVDSQYWETLKSYVFE
jgi:hypothetical protein